MKLTNREVLQAQAKMMELSGREDIPIQASLDIALISNQIDTQVRAYQGVLGNLYKKYSVKTEQLGADGIQFVCTAEGEGEEATAKLRGENLDAFAERFNDLLEANTGDMQFNKIKLPPTITVKPSILKALIEFIEIEQG